MTVRFVLYSHDGLGLGHLRRNLVLAEALTANVPSPSVLVVTGADEIDCFAIPPSVDVVKLPGLRKVSNDCYVPRRLSRTGRMVPALRRRLLTALVETFRPQVLVADKHPAGVGGELSQALEVLAARGGVAVLGLRDVLDDPGAVQREWSANGLWRYVAEHHRLVLVYGRRDLFDPLRRSGCPRSVRERARYCGYVVGSPTATGCPADLPASGGARPLVLATVGGGADGAALLRTFVDASSTAGWAGVAITGPQAAQGEHDALVVRAATRGVEVRRLVPDLTLNPPNRAAESGSGSNGNAS